MALLQDTQAMGTANNRVDNVLQGKAIQNIPFEAEAYALSVAAVADQAGVSIELYAGQRRLIEQAKVTKAAEGVYPQVPENLLIADEVVLPGEVLVMSATNGSAANANLNYRVSVDPV